mmetsp:Transcript_73892/g.175880  ORF Transcript_73892/g.175880 Transcript_73892/m.175880 type:complete len:281 (+) Transcript_73892:86-928(+)
MKRKQPDGDTVTFNVGGQHHEVLELTIRSQPDTLLCTLLDTEEDASKPIFVNRDGSLFRYILAWYRHASANTIFCPITVSVEEMQQECKFYQLPETVVIKRERLWNSLPTVLDALAKESVDRKSEAQAALSTAQEECSKALAAYQNSVHRMLAASIFSSHLEALGCSENGSSLRVVRESQLSTNQNKCSSCNAWRVSSPHGACHYLGQCADYEDVKKKLEEMVKEVAFPGGIKAKIKKQESYERRPYYGSEHKEQYTWESTLRANCSSSDAAAVVDGDGQ